MSCGKSKKEKELLRKARLRERLVLAAAVHEKVTRLHLTESDTPRPHAVSHLRRLGAVQNEKDKEEEVAPSAMNRTRETLSHNEDEEEEEEGTSLEGLSSLLSDLVPSIPETASSSSGIAADVRKALEKGKNGSEGEGGRWEVKKEEVEEEKEEHHDENDGGANGSVRSYVLEPLSEGALRFLGQAARVEGAGFMRMGAEEDGPLDSTPTTSTPPDRSLDPSRTGPEFHERRTKKEEEDDEKVVLPPLLSDTSPRARITTTSRGTRPSGSFSRKVTKMSWEKLKLAVLQRFGPEGLEMVEAADGNAADPLFTVAMKVQHRGSVPVPFHWDRLRPFLSNQADREASAVVPLRVQRLGVSELRARKNHHEEVDHLSFMSCFLTGTPLQRHGFGMQGPPYLCSTVGDVFWEGKWMPPPALAGTGTGEGGQMVPGSLSNSLREALGLTLTSPPPWLYAMQELRRLPPAYPELWMPGLNAPIPVGAQWGKGMGQWGQPPRGADQNFLFPGVMDEAAATGAASSSSPSSAASSSSVGTNTHAYLQRKGVWGRVPALVPPTPEEWQRLTAEAQAAAKRAKRRRNEKEDEEEGGGAGGGARGMARTVPPPSTGGDTDGASTPSITPMPFLPKTFAEVHARAAPIASGAGGTMGLASPSSSSMGGGESGMSRSGPLQREYVHVLPGGGEGQGEGSPISASRSTIAVGASFVPKPTGSTTGSQGKGA